MQKVSLRAALAAVHWIRWNPNLDLAIVALSWVLVVAALSTATRVGPGPWGGMAYFGLYAVVGALLCGVGIPLFWMVGVRKRPLAELGISKRWLGLSIGLQLILAVAQYLVLPDKHWPSFTELLPLLALALCIGFFEAFFWRGWVLQRLEESFGLLPAILLGCALYALYHIGYGMPWSEMLFLFFIGMMYAVTFRVTRNIFILWPLFQPLGQMVTLVKDGLALPVMAALGFIEALALMALFIWLAARYYRKHHPAGVKAADAAGAESVPASGS